MVEKFRPPHEEFKYVWVDPFTEMAEQIAEHNSRYLSSMLALMFGQIKPPVHTKTKIQHLKD